MWIKSGQYPKEHLLCLQTVHQEYPWGECNPDIKLRNFTTYSTYGCLKECKAQRIQQLCGCLPFLLPGRWRQICSPQAAYFEE